MVTRVATTIHAGITTLYTAVTVARELILSKLLICGQTIATTIAASTADAGIAAAF